MEAGTGSIYEEGNGFNSMSIKRCNITQKNTAYCAAAAADDVPLGMLAVSSCVRTKVIDMCVTLRMLTVFFVFF